MQVKLDSATIRESVAKPSLISSKLRMLRLKLIPSLCSHTKVRGAGGEGEQAQDS